MNRRGRPTESRVAKVLTVDEQKPNPAPLKPHTKPSKMMNRKKPPRMTTKSEVIPSPDARVTVPVVVMRTMTEEVRGKVIGTIQMGADLALAAKVVGVGRRTILDCMKADPKFREAIEEARAFADDNVIRCLYTAATQGNVSAMMFWLKNRKPNEWRDQHDVVNKGADLVSKRLEISCTPAPAVGFAKEESA